jgi:hypothetical protein
MIMYKNGIPLRSQEDIGHELGLTVPLESATLFHKVHTERPASGLWGTQIGETKYEINGALKRLGIPLNARIEHINEIKSPANLENALRQIEKTDGDALVCFKYGTLWDTESASGHVCVFDRVADNQIHLVDPGQQVPKLRTVSPDKLYESMVQHTTATFPGIWILEKI